MTIANLHGQAAIEAFSAGKVDYLQAGQPLVEELLESGRAYLARAMGPEVGPIPFSSLLTTSARCQMDPTLCRDTVRALARAQQWMVDQPAAAIARLLTPDFPTIPEVRLQRVIARFQAADTWPSEPVLRRAPFERLGRILVDGGLIRNAGAFEQLVDRRFALEAGTTRRS
jgi:ABC-type nitrate/sulfonate/bicarbonate transport system substrate-binding protein